MQKPRRRVGRLLAGLAVIAATGITAPSVAQAAPAPASGSPTVVVGDIDTGLDYRHPDLRQNVSDADSANCVSGAPVQGAAAAQDDNGHGTHTAGTIAAAANGIGVVGVAPNVRIAGIKAG